MNTKLSILFYAKRAKTNTDVLIPIYILVTVDGERIELSTNRFSHPDKWSIEGSCMKGTSAESKAANSYLDALKVKIYDYQQQLIRKDELVNAENMRNKILGIEKRSHMPSYTAHIKLLFSLLTQLPIFYFANDSSLCSIYLDFHHCITMSTQQLPYCWFMNDSNSGNSLFNLLL